MKKELLKKNIKAYRSYLRWLEQACFAVIDFNLAGMPILRRARSHF